MTSICFNSPSPLSMVEDNQDQENHLFYIKTSQVSPSSCPIFLNSTQELEKEEHGREPSQHPKHQEDEVHGRFSMADGAPNCKQDNHDHGQCKNGSGPIKWMSSKMRLMRKMMNSDRSDKKVSENMQNSQPCEEEKNQSSSSYNTFNNTRVCSDCNTTKTPLWRSGPRGPKSLQPTISSASRAQSLCNACGIRQRKARRAMAAAAAGSGDLIASNTSMRGEVLEEKQSDGDQMTQYKKRCKIAAARSQKKLRFEEFTISLRENSAFHRVFPQDEKDAAILLMALSWGLIHS